MKLEPEGTVRANDYAWEEKMPWHPIHSECYHYGKPGYDPYAFGQGNVHRKGGRSPNRGVETGEDVHDGTLALALQRTANRMVAEVIPPGMKWAGFQPASKDGDSREQKRRQDELDKGRDVCFDTMGVSGFDQASHEMVHDCIISGTGVTRCGESHDSGAVVEIDSTSQTEVALQRGPGGKVWGYHRQMEMELDHIKATWRDGEPPKEDAPKDRTKAGQPRLHTVYESTYYDWEEGWWYEDIVCPGGDNSSGKVHRVLERRHPVSRWTAWRWDRMPGEVYGRSPCMDALPNARTLSELVGTLLATASLRVAGIFTYVHDGVLNPSVIRMRSGALIPVSSNAADNPTLRPLEVGGDVNMAQFILEDERNAVKMQAHDRSLPEVSEGIRTAAEWHARVSELRMDIGPVMGRFIFEFVIPFMQNLVYVLQSAGKLDMISVKRGKDLKPALLTLNRGEESAMNLVVTGPYAQAQKLAEIRKTEENIERARMTAGDMAVEAAVKLPRVVSHFGEMGEISGDLYHSKSQAEENYAEARQAQLAAAQPPQPNPTGQPMEVPQ